MKPTIEDLLPDGKENFSPKEVSAIIPVDESTISRWCQAGKIQAYKPVGRWSITREAVIKLLVGFGIATAAFFHGNHTHFPYCLDHGEIYHENCRLEAQRNGHPLDRI